VWGVRASTRAATARTLEETVRVEPVRVRPVGRVVVRTVHVQHHEPATRQRDAEDVLRRPGAGGQGDLVAVGDAGRTEDVPAKEAVGRVCAEQITPYPPGIPVLLPGERIGQDALDYLLTGVHSGMVLPDPTDPQLETVRVVA
jgi:hypothetical protein